MANQTLYRVSMAAAIETKQENRNVTLHMNHSL